jgi:hypothetical protein
MSLTSPTKKKNCNSNSRVNVFMMVEMLCFHKYRIKGLLSRCSEQNSIELTWLKKITIVHCLEDSRIHGPRN